MVDEGVDSQYFLLNSFNHTEMCLPNKIQRDDTGKFLARTSWRHLVSDKPLFQIFLNVSKSFSCDSLHENAGYKIRT